MGLAQLHHPRQKHAIDDKTWKSPQAFHNLNSRDGVWVAITWQRFSLHVQNQSACALRQKGQEMDRVISPANLSGFSPLISTGWVLCVFAQTSLCVCAQVRMCVHVHKVPLAVSTVQSGCLLWSTVYSFYPKEDLRGDCPEKDIVEGNSRKNKYSKSCLQDLKVLQSA